MTCVRALIAGSFLLTSLNTGGFLPADDLKNDQVVNVLDRLTSEGRTRPVPITSLYKLDDKNRIVELSLKGANFQEEDVRILAGLEHVQKLDLSRSNIKDEWLRYLRQFKNLNELSLYSTGVSSTGIEFLKMMVQIEKLELGRTKIDDRALDVCRTLSNLTRIGLRSCRISRTGIQKIAKLSKLRSLDLGDTELGDESMDIVGSMTALKTVVLDQTKVTHKGLESLTRSPHLGWIISPEKTMQEFVRRVRNNDFVEAGEMSPVGLTLPNAGTYSKDRIVAHKRTVKDMTRRQTRFRVEFYWEVAERAPRTLFAEFAIDRGAVKMMEMGLEE